MTANLLLCNATYVVLALPGEKKAERTHKRGQKKM
jgi:hypothetical protein